MGDERRGQQMVPSAVIPPRATEPPEPPRLPGTCSFCLYTLNPLALVQVDPGCPTHGTQTSAD
jgi:hypothetical protein